MTGPNIATQAATQAAETETAQAAKYAVYAVLSVSKAYCLINAGGKAVKIAYTADTKTAQADNIATAQAAEKCAIVVDSQAAEIIGKAQAGEIGKAKAIKFADDTIAPIVNGKADILAALVITSAVPVKYTKLSGNGKAEYNAETVNATATATAQAAKADILAMLGTAQAAETETAQAAETK